MWGVAILLFVFLYIVPYIKKVVNLSVKVNTCKKGIATSIFYIILHSAISHINLAFTKHSAPLNKSIIGLELVFEPMAYWDSQARPDSYMSKCPMNDIHIGNKVIYACSTHFFSFVEAYIVVGKSNSAVGELGRKRAGKKREEDR